MTRHYCASRSEPGYHKDKQDLDSIKQIQAAFREDIISYNNQVGYRMKHCIRCGVGIKLMTYKMYDKRYTDTSCICGRCNKATGG